MIKKYIFDGNNLIGKISDLWALQKNDPQMSRVKLVKYIDQYFSNKNIKVSLHFDGFAAEPIPSSKAKISYSNNYTADSNIRKEIDNSKNPKVMTVVSSDHAVQNYAKVNSCGVIASEEFAKLLKSKKNKKKEEDIAKTISNDEMKKLFGVD